MSSQPTEIELVTIDKLRFDLKNPRLPSIVKEQQSEQGILKWMLDQEKTVELMIAIGEQGYFRGEPVLVVEHPEQEETYIVVEGNRRLAAVKLLNEPALAPVKKRAVARAASEANDDKIPTEMPVIVFGSRDEILQYLGYRHVTGIKDWDTLSKARYLEQLFQWTEEEDLNEKFRSLARSIGSRSDYVQRLLVGLVVYEHIEEHDFFDIPGLSEQDIDFSVLTTALYYTDISEFVGTRNCTYPDVDFSSGKLEELTRWIFEPRPELGGKTRLGESRNLDLLSKVVGNEEALSAFRHGAPLKEAAMLTDVPLSIFQEAIRKAKMYLETARNYIHEVPALSQEEARVLENIKTLAGDLTTLVRKRLSNPEDDQI